MINNRYDDKVKMSMISKKFRLTVFFFIIIIQPTCINFNYCILFFNLLTSFNIYMYIYKSRQIFSLLNSWSNISEIKINSFNTFLLLLLNEIYSDLKKTKYPLKNSICILSFSQHFKNLIKLAKNQN